MKIIDINKISWLFPPAPLLPSSLRKIWAPEPLPEWVRIETGLPQNATLEALDGRVWDSMKNASSRLQHYLVYYTRNHYSAIQNIKCMERSWPIGLSHKDVAWRTRTRKCLERTNLLQNERQLVQLTFMELLHIKGMGVLGALDFCATLEGVMDMWEQLSFNLGQGPNDLKASFIATLEDLLSEEWPAQISSGDPRFSTLLPPADGTLQERLENLLIDLEGFGRIADAQELVKSVKEIHPKIRVLNNCFLEDCLEEFLGLISKANGKRLAALSARFGWNGEDPVTLEEVGSRIGTTRERIRQIQVKILSKIPAHEVLMPRLDQALLLLEECAPLNVQAASDLLQKNGITKNKFSIKSLLDSAILLHKTTALKLCDTRSGKILVNEKGEKNVKLLPVLARKLAGRAGVTSVYEVFEALPYGKNELEETNVREILTADPHFDFLDEDWFWAPDIKNSRNRLRNVARKILSVVSPQTVHSIRGGARRLYRMRAICDKRYTTLVVPPQSAMKAFFERHREFKVEGELVYPSSPLDYTVELGDSDKILVDALRSSPNSLMDRNSYCEACLARGMNENTFSVFSTYSPVVEHVELNIWKLRGTEVSAATVEAVRKANRIKPRDERVLDSGWSKDGKLWIAAKIPRIGKNNMVIGCPSTIKRFLMNQQFQGIAKDSKITCCTIGINEAGFSYGYAPFIRRYGLDENDVLLAEFDLSTNEALLSIADEESLNSI